MQFVAMQFVAMQFVVLGAISVGLNTAVDAVVVLAAMRVRRAVLAAPRVMRRVQQGSRRDPGGARVVVAAGATPGLRRCFLSAREPPI